MVSYFLAKNATSIMRETISSWGRALGIIQKRMVRVHYCYSFKFWRFIRYHYEKPSMFLSKYSESYMQIIWALKTTYNQGFKNRAIGGEQL